MTVRERAKLGIICVLLLLVLGYVAFSAINTVQAVRNFQQQYSDARSGNVNTIRPWMTLHAIEEIYHVPKDYLYQTLNVSENNTFRHATLYTIASSKRQTVDKLIHTIQLAILTYRKAHPKGHPLPVRPGPVKPTPTSHLSHPSTKPRRTTY